jgi:2-oxoisovalerate dehydrogenase E2 component (dihydrolipoyl transacylase)
MSRQTFVLPDLGEGLTEAQLVRWFVRIGDVVDIDSPVAEVETAKAMVEVPSPYGGIVVERHGDEGATIQVGQPLISIAPEATRGADAPANGSRDGGHAEESPSYVNEEHTGSGNVLVGYGTGTSINGRRRRRHRTPTSGTTTSAATVAGSVTAVERPRAKSPIVRKLARELEVDLRAVTGTGSYGLVTRTDVERAAARPVPAEPVAQLAGEPSVLDASDQRTGLPIREHIPFHGMRKAIARTLTRSRQEIPEATTWVDVDATALMELRASLNTGTDRGPGLLALVARFVVAGLARFPALNARVDEQSEQILHLDGVNLGIATQADHGLVVPAVRHAHLLTARALDKEIRRLTAAARDGSATAAELGSGSFTLNNYGSLGVDGSAAIINHPEVAILGMGRIIERPWVVNGQIVPRQLTQLSLVFDHRVCDGATAAGFLRFVADTIESPLAALADL